MQAHAPASSPAARVALLSDQSLHPAEWGRRGMSTVRVRQVAFERLLADTPDAIVLDVASADARQVAECWQLYDLLAVPVIVLAPGAASAEVVAYLERGAAEVVTETPDSALLAARVAAVLRRARRSAADRLTTMMQLSGGVSVDLVRRVVHRPEGAQSLSRTEFSLLLALLRAGGRACPHGELITRVWGAESASATHYLRLYIRYLRGKIEADPDRPRHILNVWGTGYRLALGLAAEAAQRTDAAPAAAKAALPLAAACAGV